VVRRLTQGAVEKSALFRTMTGLNAAALPIAYWPLESEGTLASVLATAADGGVDGTVSANLILGSSTSPPAGSAGAVSFESDINTLTDDFRLRITSYTATTHVVTTHVRQSMDDAPSGTEQILGIIGWDVDGTLNTSVSAADMSISWYGGIGLNPTALQFQANNAALTLTVAMDVSDGEWHEIQVRATQNGANVDFELWVDGSLGDSDTSASKTVGKITQFRGIGGIPLDGAGSPLDGAILLGICHFSLHGDASVGQFYDAMGGYLGEEAHTRFDRVCAEEGIPYSGTATGSVRMGPQPVADVMAVLRDCEDVDHGMLIEDFAFGLDYRSSRQRENLPPTMTVDLSTYKTTSGTQADVLTPTRNDARIRNEWSIGRPDGVTRTAKDEAHQAKRGRYNDSATVNVETDDDTLQEAYWRVHEGTFEGLRYDTMPLDLGANE
jgi:hypothetical protein